MANGAIAVMSYGRARTAEAPAANASRARSSSPDAAPTRMGKSDRRRTAATILAASTVLVCAAITRTSGASAPTASSASAPSRHHVVSIPSWAPASISWVAIVGSVSASTTLPRDGGIGRRCPGPIRMSAPRTSMAKSPRTACSEAPKALPCPGSVPARLAKPPGNVVLGGLLRRVGEHLLRVVDLDQLPRFAGRLEIEECGLVADAGGLLHVMSHDHDGEVELQFGDQVLNRQGGDGIEGRAGLVHQQHVGLHGDRAGDAEALLLAAGKPTARLVQAVLDLVPQVGALQGSLRGLVE